jgi:hypothetical protein
MALTSTLRTPLGKPPLPENFEVKSLELLIGK